METRNSDDEHDDVLSPSSENVVRAENPLRILLSCKESVDKPLDISTVVLRDI